MAAPETQNPKPFTPPEGENLGDRFGGFTPEIGAQQDAGDALPSHEDLLTRQKHIPLTDKERADGLEAVEEAKRILGYK